MNNLRSVLFLLALIGVAVSAAARTDAAMDGDNNNNNACHWICVRVGTHVECRYICTLEQTVYTVKNIPIKEETSIDAPSKRPSPKGRFQRILRVPVMEDDSEEQ